MALAEAQANAASPEELAAAQEKLEQAQAAEEAARVAVEQAQTEVTQAQTAKQAADQAVEQAQENFDAKSLAKQEADAAQESAQAEYDEAVAAKEALEEAMGDVAAAQERVEQAQAALENANQNAEVKAAELADAQTTLTQRQQVATEKQAALEAAEVQRQTACDEAEQAAAKLADLQYAKDSADSAVAEAETTLAQALVEKEAADEALRLAKQARDAAKTKLEQTTADIERYSKRGSLGMFEWLLTQDGLTEAQIADLNNAKSIIEQALAEDVSSWSPDLTDFNGNPMQGLETTGGKTATLDSDLDAISLKNTLVIKDFFTAVENYIASDDPYRKKFVDFKKAEQGGNELENGGVPMTSFSIIASAQINANRDSFYRMHNPKWHEFGANQEVLSSAGIPGRDIELWNSEKQFYDQALKELGLSLDTLEYSTDPESDWQKMQRLALKKAEEANWATGHYEFFLYSHANRVMGYGATQAFPGQTGFYGTNGTAQATIIPTGNRMTFDEMRAFITRYEEFLDSADAEQQAYEEAESNVTAAEKVVDQRVATVADAQEAVRDAETKADGLAEQVAQAQEALEQANQKCADCQAAVDDAEAAANAANSAVGEAEQAVEVAQAAKTSADEDVATAEQELEQAQEVLDSLDNAEALEAATRRVQVAREALDAANEAATSATADLNAAEQALAGAKSDAQSRLNALNTAQSALAQAQNDLTNASNSVVQAEEELAPLEEANQELVSAQATLRSALSRKQAADKAATEAQEAADEAQAESDVATATAEAAQAKAQAFAGLTPEGVAENGISQDLINTYPELGPIASLFETANGAANAAAEAQSNYDDIAAQLAEAIKNRDDAANALSIAKRNLALALKVYEDMVNPPLTPGAPGYINPSASDPASCTVNPYVTITPMDGVIYRVTVDGKLIKANADGTYSYPYGKTVKVTATPEDGKRFAEDAITNWSWTSALADECKTPSEGGDAQSKDDPAKPIAKDNQGPKHLVKTGANVNVAGPLALLAAGAGLLTFSRKKGKHAR